MLDYGDFKNLLRSNVTCGVHNEYSHITIRCTFCISVMTSVMYDGRLRDDAKFAIQMFAFKYLVRSEFW